MYTRVIFVRHCFKKGVLVHHIPLVSQAMCLIFYILRGNGSDNIL